MLFGDDLSNASSEESAPGQLWVYDVQAGLPLAGARIRMTEGSVAIRQCEAEALELHGHVHGLHRDIGGGL